MAFGSFANLNSLISAQSTLMVTCASGLTWTAVADGGSNGFTGGYRQLSGPGGSKLSYCLVVNPINFAGGQCAAWGDPLVNFIFNAIVNSSTGAAQTATIYGYINAGQNNIATGTYQDTVNVTVTYQ
jgi:spore coat protein U-like protein